MTNVDTRKIKYTILSITMNDKVSTFPKEECKRRGICEKQNLFPKTNKEEYAKQNLFLKYEKRSTHQRNLFRRTNVKVEKRNTSDPNLSQTTTTQPRRGEE